MTTRRPTTTAMSRVKGRDNKFTHRSTIQPSTKQAIHQHIGTPFTLTVSATSKHTRFSPMTVSARSIELAKEWAGNDPNPTTTKYVTDLLGRISGPDGNEAATATAATELSKLFPDDGSRISFGTAGLRAAMQPGPLSMNDLTVVQTAQGLAKYCLQQELPVKSSDGKRRLVIGHDHRKNPSLQISSLSFALLTAMVFEEAGMESVLLEGFVLTPLVPYSLQELGAVAGIMVTASHNPKQDDGYKVYAADGCQIRAPMDKEISAEIMKNLQPWKDYGAILEERRKAFPSDPYLGFSQPETTKKLLDDYFASVLSSGLKTGQATVAPDSQSLPAPQFAYSAMHGVGRPFAERIFHAFDLPPFQSVPSQGDTDFEFPTVPFPNPEEKGALDLAKSFAAEKGCDIVLANDPDADRLAVAERSRSSGDWTVFSGDQIGTMMGYWLWSQIGAKLDKPVSMCASTVSSKMLAEIARVEGFHFEDTLSGFKWIGSRSAELNSSGHHHLFAYEEAIGFACGNQVFDKDGISAMAVFAEMSLWVYRNGMVLTDFLQSLYTKYGEFVSYNGYYFIEDSSIVDTVMERIRAGGKYDLDLGPYKVEAIRDLGGEGYDSSKPDKKPTLPTTPMISIGFTNGCLVQLRPSGTEPKFKFYIEMKGKPSVPREAVQKELMEMAPHVLDILLQPEKNGLKMT